MTTEKMKFLTLFMGEEERLTMWWCEKCQDYIHGNQVTFQEYHEKCGYPVISRDEPTFFEVKEYMEKTWPNLWEGYLKAVGDDLFMNTWANAVKGGLLIYLHGVLDLDNLFTFLVEKKEEIGKDHPAYKYLESLEE